MKEIHKGLCMSSAAPSFQVAQVPFCGRDINKEASTMLITKEILIGFQFVIKETMIDFIF